MTEKLFENDSFLLKGKCTVTSCKAVDGGFAVITDKTLFFPEGGGQPGDRGRLGKSRVLDTRFDEQGGNNPYMRSKPLRGQGVRYGGGSLTSP